MSAKTLHYLMSKMSAKTLHYLSASIILIALIPYVASGTIMIFTITVNYEDIQNFVKPITAVCSLLLAGYGIALLAGFKHKGVKNPDLGILLTGVALGIITFSIEGFQRTLIWPILIVVSGTIRVFSFSPPLTRKERNG